MKHKPSPTGPDPTRAETSTPAIAGTALAMTGDCQRFLDPGLIDWVVKPVDQAALLETMRRHLA